MGQSISRGPLGFVCGLCVKAVRLKCKGFNTKWHRGNMRATERPLCQTEFNFAYSCLVVSKP
jgi:hypothetical protein